MPQTPIDKLYQDNKALLKYLGEQGEVSFQLAVEDNFRKILLLAAASYFESILVDELKQFFSEYSDPKQVVLLFVQNKAMSRQYHTYFDWKSKNANQFFGLFGDGFKLFMQEQIKANGELDGAIRAFLEIGSSRNVLVHENFAAQTLNTTADEIYDLYKLALGFVTDFCQKLRQYITTSAQVAQNRRDTAVP